MAGPTENGLLGRAEVSGTLPRRSTLRWYLSVFTPAPHDARGMRRSDAARARGIGRGERRAEAARARCIGRLVAVGRSPRSAARGATAQHTRVCALPDARPHARARLARPRRAAKASGSSGRGRDAPGARARGHARVKRGETTIAALRKALADASADREAAPRFGRRPGRCAVGRVPPAPCDSQRRSKRVKLSCSALRCGFALSSCCASAWSARAVRRSQPRGAASRARRAGAQRRLQHGASPRR